MNWSEDQIVTTAGALEGLFNPAQWRQAAWMWLESSPVESSPERLQAEIAEQEAMYGLEPA